MLSKFKVNGCRLNAVLSSDWSVIGQFEISPVREMLEIPKFIRSNQLPQQAPEVAVLVNVFRVYANVTKNSY